MVRQRAEERQERDKQKAGCSKGEEIENMDTKGDEKSLICMNQNKPLGRKRTKRPTAESFSAM